jgi:RNA polymerase sigma-70 factor, ECF subfamily
MFFGDSNRNRKRQPKVMSITMTGTTGTITGTDPLTETERLESRSIEATLVKQAAAGDRHAFEQLFERYHRPMASVVSRLVSGPEDVNDIVQDVFIRAWNGLPNFRGDAQFSTWLHKIAINTALKHRARYRKEKENISVDDMLIELPQSDNRDDPYLSAERKEEVLRLRQAVSRLPEKQRVVVVLHYLEGHSCEEVSQMIGCSVGTVWSRLHYAFKKLKGTLGRDNLL